MIHNNLSMQAAVLYGPDDLRLEHRPVPETVPGSVILKVDACAICGSDLRILKSGNPRITEPRIIGHEVAGTFIEVGDGVDKFRIGDRVSVGADIPCGKCHHCISGHANNCDVNLAIGYQFDGGYAEYIRLEPVVVQYGPVKKFSSAISSTEAALAEPLGCCINGYELVYMAKGASVAVFGAGPIGIMLISLAKTLYGSRQVVSIEPQAQRRAAALKYGADLALDPTVDNVYERVMELSGGAGIDRIFTACPSVETHEQAVAMVAKRGFVNLFGGLSKGSRPILVDSNWLHYREAYLTGSHGATPAHHARALELIEQGVIDAKSFITHEVPLGRIAEGFQIAASGDAVKVVIHAE